MLLETQRIIKGTNGELWEVEDVPFDSWVGPRICIALSPSEPWRDSLQKKLELDFVPDTITTWQLFLLNFHLCVLFRFFFPSFFPAQQPQPWDWWWMATSRDFGEAAGQQGSTGRSHRRRLGGLRTSAAHHGARADAAGHEAQTTLAWLGHLGLGRCWGGRCWDCVWFASFYTHIYIVLYRCIIYI